MTTILGPRTLAETVAWIHTHPAKHGTNKPVGDLSGGPWANSTNSWCEELMNNSGGFGSVNVFSTAALAGSNSGPLDTNMATAKPGEFVYWTNHVGLVVSPGTMICASQTFAGNGTGWGLIEIAKYSILHPTQHWRGHSYRHGNYQLKPNPVPPPIPNVRIPVGVALKAGDFYTAGEYTLSMSAAGLATVSALGHTHTAFPKAPVGAYLVFQADGHLVLYYTDAKGKRRVQWASDTYRKAAGGELILYATGSLVIFDKNHRVVQILVGQIK